MRLALLSAADMRIGSLAGSPAVVGRVGVTGGAPASFPAASSSVVLCGVADVGSPVAALAGAAGGELPVAAGVVLVGAGFAGLASFSAAGGGVAGTTSGSASGGVSGACVPAGRGFAAGAGALAQLSEATLLPRRRRCSFAVRLLLGASMSLVSRRTAQASARRWRRSPFDPFAWMLSSARSSFTRAAAGSSRASRRIRATFSSPVSFPVRAMALACSRVFPSRSSIVLVSLFPPTSPTP